MYGIDQSYWWYYQNLESPVNCAIFPNQSAGMYNVTELTAYGYARINQRAVIENIA